MSKAVAWRGPFPDPKGLTCWHLNLDHWRTLADNSEHRKKPSNRRREPRLFSDLMWIETLHSTERSLVQSRQWKLRIWDGYVSCVRKELVKSEWIDILACHHWVLGCFVLSKMLGILWEMTGRIDWSIFHRTGVSNSHCFNINLQSCSQICWKCPRFLRELKHRNHCQPTSLHSVGSWSYIAHQILIVVRWRHTKKVVDSNYPIHIVSGVSRLVHDYLGGSLQTDICFSQPQLGEMIQFDLRRFFRWVAPPPSSYPSNSYSISNHFTQNSNHFTNSAWHFWGFGDG